MSPEIQLELETMDKFWQGFKPLTLDQKQRVLNWLRGVVEQEQQNYWNTAKAFPMLGTADNNIKPQ